MGDFNAMIDSSEKQGGGALNQSSAAEFRDCIRDCNLFDMGFTGPKFTWFRRKLKERLDRCLANTDWVNLFSDSSTVHLERIKSYHRPLLIRTSNNARYISGPRPFRFNAAWFGHDNFSDFLDQSWKRGRDLCLSLQDFQDSCITWNKDVFGHIFKRKRLLERRLQQLELLTQSNRSDRLAAAEESVRIELEKTLWQENLLWLQKSRMQWIKDGDHNTKFFHLSTLRRRKANQIQGLKLEDGTWIFDDPGMKEVAVNHFLDLFKAGSVTSLEPGAAIFANPLSDAEGQQLAHHPTFEDLLSQIYLYELLRMLCTRFLPKKKDLIS
ncbi:hypothetical protein LINPERHAP2_LOCUS15567 [Linum perenne]